MTWVHLAEKWRCDGRNSLDRRCKAELVLASVVWLDGLKVYCADCALDPQNFPDLTAQELAERRALRVKNQV